MPSPSAINERPTLNRGLTWPGVATKSAHISPPGSPATPSVVVHQPKEDQYEDEINEHPEEHYLSPVKMYEYDDWAEDSDDDGEEVEWNAGITDFALFDSDRRAAEERQEPVPDKWNDLLASQASALQRAEQRTSATTEPARPKFFAPLADETPPLTPDGSPTMRDDMDIMQIRRRRALVPDCPSIEVTPPQEDDKKESSSSDDSYASFSDDDLSDDDLPVAFLIERARYRRQQAPVRQRPGLRYHRTMSGKLHVWRRPSYEIYPLIERVDAEAAAEREDAGQQLAKTSAGERGGRTA